MISSTLEEIKRHVIPTSCSFPRETTRADKNRLMMFTQRKSVSGSNWKHRLGQLLLRHHVFRIGESGELRVRY